MARDACLVVIGEIAVGWTATEEYILKLLWLYIGTDRPTFDIIVRQQRTSDLERLLRDLVTKKEPHPALQQDVLTALQRVSVLRENRNNTLHGTTGADVVDWPLAELEAVRQQIAEGVPCLADLCSRALRFVVARDSAETPIGDESFPGVEQNDEYLAINWPPKPRKINPWKGQ